MTFQLDTSGSVILTAYVFPVGAQPLVKEWKGLTPFTQGYIEALFANIEYPVAQDTAYLPKGFSDLAPETLAVIIADCAAMVRLGLVDTQERGRSAWRERHVGEWVTFDPLTVQLGDDGKVRFAA